MTDSTNGAPNPPIPASQGPGTLPAAATAGATTTVAPGADATVAAAPATPTPSRRAARSRRSPTGLRSTLLLLLAFAVVGVAPLALTARVFHQSLLDGVPGLSALLAPIGLAATATPADMADLALPRAAWVAQATAVRASAATGATVANLAPGFPVTLLGHAATDGGIWDRISWSGPTALTGGTGWAPDAALTAVPGQGPIVGDAGALSPALATTLAQVGAGTGLAVYYPAAHRLYLTNGDQLYPLGDGVRALIAAAVLAAPNQVGPNATLLADALAGQVAQNNATFATLAYQEVGGAPGLATFLAGIGVTGIQPGVANWQAAQGTPRALTQFYALLAGATADGAASGALPADVRARALAKLAPDATTAAFAGLGPLMSAGASVTVVLGSAHSASGWSANASEIVTTSGGLTYIAVLCVRGQPSADSGTAATRAVLARLALIAQT